MIRMAHRTRRSANPGMQALRQADSKESEVLLRNPLRVGGNGNGEPLMPNLSGRRSHGLERVRELVQEQLQRR